MAKKTIFIGSASESKDLAATIARSLSDCGYEPLRWWLEFPPGSITLDRLAELARRVDGAVFLFTSVDRTWYREALTGTPRDNVVLEYGVFVAHLGRERTLVLKDQEAKLPSDINAVSFEKLSSDYSSVAERAVAHFDRLFSESLPPALEAISLVADPVVIEQQTREILPPNWYNRDLYYGLEGAKGWLAAVNEPSYWPASQEIRVRQILFKALEQVEARTFVSLGPGDARTDKEIAIRLRYREPWLQYIPVDISDGLLQIAVSSLSNQVRVPVGILGDFEDRLNFVHRQLRAYSSPPLLFSLLGNTLGDLDNYEGTFLRTLGNIMQPTDYLLLDIALAGPKWSRDLDSRGKHSSYGPAYRRFIATGVSRRTGEPVDSIVSSFESRFRFDVGVSDIPNAKSFFVQDTVSNRLVATIQRYDWEALVVWLEREMGFKVLFKGDAIMDDGVLGDGLLLLKSQR